MGRNLTQGQDVGCFSADLSLDIAVAAVHGCIALKVWKSKGDSSIAAVGCAQQCEQGLVLVEWHQLAITCSPSSRGEAEGEYANLAEKWFSHGRKKVGGAWKN